MARSPITIIGIGNYLMGDEGAGIHAVEKLRSLEWGPDIEVIDGGTPGVALLHIIEGRKFAIIIDCADFGGRPGEIAVFDPGDLRRDERTEAGLHATDLLTTLELARVTGNYPEKVVIIGIQPKEISMGTTMSAEVQGAIERVEEVIRKELVS